MSLLSIVQNAADIIGVPRPASVISSSDQTVLTMLALLNREGKNLARLRNTWGGGWSVLELEHSFPTVALQDEYALPVDFSRLISETVWDQSSFFQVRGPLSPQEWQAARSGLAATPALRKRFRIKRATGKDRKFFLDPIPSQVETVVFEYLTDRWVSDAAGTTFRTAFAAADDTGLLDEDLLEMGLIWRFQSAKGFDFAAWLADYELQRDARIAGDGGTRRLSLARNRFRLPPANVPDSNLGV